MGGRERIQNLGIPKTTPWTRPGGLPILGFCGLGITGTLKTKQNLISPIFIALRQQTVSYKIDSFMMLKKAVWSVTPFSRTASNIPVYTGTYTLSNNSSLSLWEQEREVGMASSWSAPRIALGDPCAWATILPPQMPEFLMNKVSVQSRAKV